jgi:hypothetical protein
MKEEESGEVGLQQLQYVFLELPKYDKKSKPKTMVEKWAYFFREAERLREVPAELAEAPFAEALDVVRRVNFTDWEWTEYERSKMAEQDYRGGLTFAVQQGVKRGIDQGKAQSVLLVLQARGVPVNDKVRAQVLGCLDGALLDRWLQRAATAKTADEVVTG